MTIVVKNNLYSYFQDSIQTKKGSYKTVSTIIGRTDLADEELNIKKSSAYTKHFIKILKEISFLKKQPYRFRNKPTVMS